MKSRLHESVWSFRDFRLAVAGRGVSAIGDGITQLALMIHVHDRQGGPGGVAAVIGVSALAVVLFAPWAGGLVDRHDSRVLAVSGSLVAAAGAAGLGLEAGAPLWTAYVLVFVIEAAQTVVGPTWGALTPRIVGPLSAPVAVGWLQSVDNGARILGPAIGGLLVGVAGIAAAFAADSASFVAIAVAACAVRTRRHLNAEATAGDTSAARPGRNGRARMLAGLDVIRADVLLWPLVIALMAFVVGAEASNVLDVFLVRDALGASTSAYGAVSAVIGCGLVVGSLAATRLRSSGQRVRMLFTCLGATSLVIIAEGLAPTLVVLAALSLVGGVSNGLINASFGGVVVERVADADRGRAGSAINALVRVASLVALGLGAFIGSVTGPRVGFVTCGTGTGFVLLVIGPWTRARLRARSRIGGGRPVAGGSPA